MEQNNLVSENDSVLSTVVIKYNVDYCAGRTTPIHSRARTRIYFPAQ